MPNKRGGRCPNNFGEGGGRSENQHLVGQKQRNVYTVGKIIFPKLISGGGGGGYVYLALESNNKYEFIHNNKRSNFSFIDI